jgi:transcriptional regulator GlxA family with amidase domain
LLVAGGEGVEVAIENPVLVDWVRKRAAQARRVASVCTGAFMLAAAGVLDGRRAATHWKYCTKLAQRFPAVHVEPDPIFVCDGPVWTSAGVTAGIDLALALVEEDLGRSVALAVARYLVVFLKRPGGQAQFSAALALQAVDDKFGLLHDWINGHLADDLSLSVLADQAGMSERSFSRHYAEATGQTPARAIERLRVDAARRLLSESRHPVKRVAQRCGFGSEETMRRNPAGLPRLDKANLGAQGLAEMPKSPRFSPNPVRVIDVLAYPAVQLLDVTGPVQVFASANDLIVGGPVKSIWSRPSNKREPMRSSVSCGIMDAPDLEVGLGVDDWQILLQKSEVFSGGVSAAAS